MKAVRTAVVILVILCILIGIHSYIMNNMAKKIIAECDKIKLSAQDEDWESTLSRLDTIESIWKKHRTWAALTIDTEDIEQIEISLAQSRAFAEAKQLSGFVGEFVMFSKLIEHIPIHEGFHIEEIL